MLGQPFATILARTDPFDVAQALERYICTLTSEQIRGLIQASAARMNDWYRSEFVPLLDEPDEDRLRSAFAHSLKSNLRAIPLFGPEFCDGVIEKLPGDRAVALGEEGSGAWRARPLAFLVIALALLLGGAAVEHVLNNARANANTPVVLLTPEPVLAAATVAPTPSAAKPSATPQPTPTAQPQTPSPRTPAPKAVATSRPTPVPVVAEAPRPALPAPVAARPIPRAPTRSAPRRTPAPGRGVKTIVAQEPRPTPAPEPTPVDTSDMPQSYTDATPLPTDATAPPANVTTSVHVPTPTPGPNRSWTHRLVHAAVHIVNSTLSTVGVGKKAAQPNPSASPSGPQP